MGETMTVRELIHALTDPGVDLEARIHLAITVAAQRTQTDTIVRVETLPLPSGPVLLIEGQL
jgi:hypothetical protein